jgi:hypothetical protein
MFKSEFRDLVPIQDRKCPSVIDILQYLSWGGAPVDWFVKQGVILGGIPLQNWMLLAIAVLLLSVLISWWTHK